MRLMSEWDEFEFESRSEEEQTLPYGIQPREVYYVCLFCGNIMSKSELDQQGDIICSRCGGRIFLKLRTPALKPRRVYAI